MIIPFPTEWKINPIAPNHQSDTGVWYRTYGNICTANVMFFGFKLIMMFPCKHGPWVIKKYTGVMDL